MHDCCAGTGLRLSRRDVVRTVALGGGAALMWTAPASRVRAAEAENLLLTCMDFRLENEIVAYMDGRGLRDTYDHVVLAGASLGVLAKAKPAWGRTFWDHLDTAIQLHHVRRVIVLDHRDCGAYKLFLGEAAVKDPAVELASHTKQLHALRAAIKAKRPKLAVELGLMGLDGQVETIA